MKEIDFIPEWYKANRNRKKSYHRQYVLLGTLMAMMMIWSFVIGQYVEQVRADVEDIQSVFERGKMTIEQGMVLEAEIAMLQQQARILDATAPRTDMSSVIAELTWLIRGSVVLSKLSMINEVIEPKQADRLTSTGVVRIGASSGGNGAAEMSLSPTRTRVTLTGVALTGADAAALISALEESAYFEQVTPVFTKAVKVKDCDVTEFEIRMYVADYTIQK
jgi:hypothetical protein